MSTDAAADQSTADQPELKRVMGPKLLLLFIVGDILGTGVYAADRRRSPARSAARPGRRSWSRSWWPPITAVSYLELVTRYPQAAGAALYTHKAFGVHFFTFLVAFTVMCSGITSASTAANAFAGFVNDGFGFDLAGRRRRASPPIALGFMLLVASVNFRGVGESVKANVVLTLVELSGLLLVIFIGLYALTQGEADFTEVVRLLLRGREGRVLRGDRGDVAGLLRHGRLRGLGQHGRGVQGPGAATSPR